MVALIVALVVASIVMVAAMVAFTTALIAPAPSRTARWGWGGLYLLTWIVISVVMLNLLQEADDAAPPAAFVLLGPGGWLTFNAFWVWFAIAIGRSAARPERASDLPPDADSLSTNAGRIAVAGLGLVVAGLVWLGVPQRAIVAIAQPGRRLASAAIALAVLGWAALVFGGARLALGVGREMTRDEIDELERSAKFDRRASSGPALYRWSKSKYRHYGRVKGVDGSVTLTFDEVRDAWRSGAWRRDPQLRVVFSMMFGAVAMVVGGAAAAFALGSGTTRVVVAAFITYAVIQAWLGIKRGRAKKQS